MAIAGADGHDNAEYTHADNPALEPIDSEARRILDQLYRLVANDAPARAVFQLDSKRYSEPDPDLLARFASTLLRFSSERSKYVEGIVSSEPDWNILLDLYVHHHRGVRISVTSACIASGVPATTALRWIEELRKRGLIRREIDEKDRRRALLSLSDAGEAQVRHALLRAYEAFGRFYRADPTGGG